MEIAELDLQQIGLHVEAEPSKDALEAFGKSLRKAFSSVGFAYIKNHGVHETLIGEAMKASKAFFLLSSEAKEAIPREPDVQQGYVAPGREIFDQKEDGTKASFEFREAFEVSRIGPDARFPDNEVPELRPALTNLALATKRLSLRVLKGLALGLGLDEFFFVHCHEKTLLSSRSISKLRSIYYPPIMEIDHEKGKLVRCGEHSDYGTVTFLYQDNMGGLEVRAVDDSWIEATPRPGSILINVGDLLEIWSNGLFRATLHRVVIPEEEKKLKTARQSIVLFVHPDSSTLVEPLITANGGRKYEPITALDHVKKRFAATYQY